MRTKKITLNAEQGAFKGFFERLRGKNEEINFTEISKLRRLFSNERARMMHTIKTQNPTSIYHLTKLLGRDFKTVREDITLLKRFGFIELDAKTKGKREILKPILIVDKVIITFNL